MTDATQGQHPYLRKSIFLFFNCLVLILIHTILLDVSLIFERCSICILGYIKLDKGA